MGIYMPARISGLIRLIGLALTLATLAACGGPLFGPKMKSIEGSVWYRERIAPPPDAVIRITLEDIAKMDVPAELIAETSITPEGGPPWNFILAYDPSKIHERGRYAVDALERFSATGAVLHIHIHDHDARDLPCGDADVGVRMRLPHLSGRVRRLGRVLESVPSQRTLAVRLHGKDGPAQLDVG